MNNEQSTSYDPLLDDGVNPENPSPLIVELAEQDLIFGTVLEIGCGSGNNALYLSGLGYPSLGIDTSMDELRVAKQKAELMLVRRGTCARFKPGNPLHLYRLGEKFDTVLDLFDFLRFSPEEQKAYAFGINKIIEPGGNLLLTVHPKGIYTTNSSMESNIINLLGSNWITIRNECYSGNGSDFMYIVLQNGQG